MVAQLDGKREGESSTQRRRGAEERREKLNAKTQRGQDAKENRIIGIFRIHRIKARSICS
jgi:hypothetical protein